jgi:hypothetical protein
VLTETGFALFKEFQELAKKVCKLEIKTIMLVVKYGSRMGQIPAREGRRFGVPASAGGAWNKGSLRF